MASLTSISEFLTPVRRLTLVAGARVIELMKAPLVQTQKADQSLVTNADHAANDILRKGLRETFPTHGILSEETGVEGPANADYLWVVDPLDGTNTYAKGQPGFSVMVGLLFRRKPVLGVVYDPLGGHLYEALRKNGCFHTHGGHRAQVFVSDRDQWAEMPIVTSTGFPDILRDHLRASLGRPFLEPIHSVGAKVGALVRGQADLYVNHHSLHYWDTCAPLIILEEAGGVMTHWDGSPLSYPPTDPHQHPGPTVASNGRRHDDLLRFLAKASGPPA